MVFIETPTNPLMALTDIRAVTAICRKKKVDLVVGGDTGPVHLSAAVGTPTVSLYRASDGKRSGPRGKRHVIVQSPLHCAKCFRTQCDRDEECCRSIKVESILSAIGTLFP
jgi:heptosyltransferase-1